MMSLDIENATNDNDNSNTTIWDTLPFPWSDILLQEIAANYLTIPDLLSLGAVSHRYKNLLGPKTTVGNRLLANRLRQASHHYHTTSGELLFIEQLPTIGKLSVEESLEKDAVLVAQLQKPALRRRSLILFPQDNNNNNSANDDHHQQQQMHQQEIISQYKPKLLSDMIRLARQYNNLPHRKPQTEFLGFNLSGVNIYCHWIDEEGQILVRDGDCIPPKQENNNNQQQQVPEATSFLIRFADLDSSPSHVFRHSSYLYHSFALCFQEGGPPFGIYQQRRGWVRFHQNGKMHLHAITILPQGQIQEVHCDSHWSFMPQQPRSFTGHYNVFCRQTGRMIPSENDNDNDTGDVDTNNNVEHSRTKEFTKAYYGVHVPSIQRANIWREPTELAMEMGAHSSASLSWINPLGEVMSQELNNGATNF